MNDCPPPLPYVIESAVQAVPGLRRVYDRASGTCVGVAILMTLKAEPGAQVDHPAASGWYATHTAVVPLDSPSLGRVSNTPEDAAAALHSRWRQSPIGDSGD
jgi:hypothetical protein